MHWSTSEPPAPPVLLGDRHARPAELGHALIELLVVRLPPAVGEGVALLARGELALAEVVMMVIAFATLWFQDPLSAYGGHWFVDNANLINFGAWVHQVPGWQSFGQPGAMLVEPIAMIGGTYVYAFV